MPGSRGAGGPGARGALRGVFFRRSFKLPGAPARRPPGALAKLVLILGGLAGCAEAPSAELEPPQLLTDSIPFVYPVELWDHHISGQTVLLLRVNELGQVDSALVDTESGYPEFDSAAVQGAQRLRFISGRQGERHVTMWTRLPVRFVRDSANQMGIGGP